MVTFTGEEVLLAASLAVIPNVNVFGVVSKSLDAADAAAPAAVRVITPLLLMAKNPELFPDHDRKACDSYCIGSCDRSPLGS
ncbi:hypothetical protein U9R62_05745 [Cylindrospermopsis raciborskii DSH]